MDEHPLSRVMQSIFLERNGSAGLAIEIILVLHITLHNNLDFSLYNKQGQTKRNKGNPNNYHK